MKLRFLIPLLVLPVLSASAAESIDDLYRKGMQAAQEGDAEAANAAFREVLRQQPNHPYARYQLGQLAQNQDKMIAISRKKAIAAVTLPEVDFHEVAFRDAIEVLGQMIEKESGKEGEDQLLAPNFVIQDATGSLGDRTVTLSLTKIPASVVLDYLLDQGGATARFEKHATVIRPAAASGGPNAAK